jgi:hypothetical protein
MPAGEPILLGTERASGGNIRATYSLRAGTRVHVFVLPEAYTAGTLAGVRDRVKEWLPLAPVGGATTAEV